MREIMRHIKERLFHNFSAEEIRSLSRILAEDLLGLDMMDYYTDRKVHLPPSQSMRLDSAISRILAGEPVQHVVGKALFCGRMFEVNGDTLVPRPETEQLVQLVADECGSRYRASVLDVGTGSGCIAVSLALEMPQAHVCACDVSAAALDVARRNAARLGAKVDFSVADVLDQTGWTGQWDVIVSNPPYIAMAEKQEMSRTVLDYEPHTALFVPDEDPLLFYRSIGMMGVRTLRPGGRIYFEINERFGRETAALLESLGYVRTSVIKDIYDKDRIVKAVYEGTD